MSDLSSEVAGEVYLAQLVRQYEALERHLSNNPHALPEAHAAHKRLAERIRSVEEELAGGGGMAPLTGNAQVQGDDLSPRDPPYGEWVPSSRD